jgi:hypothetical protein
MTQQPEQQGEPEQPEQQGELEQPEQQTQPEQTAELVEQTAELVDQTAEPGGQLPGPQQQPDELPQQSEPTQVLSPQLPQSSQPPQFAPPSQAPSPSQQPGQIPQQPGVYQQPAAPAPPPEAYAAPPAAYPAPPAAYPGQPVPSAAYPAPPAAYPAPPVSYAGQPAPPYGPSPAPRPAGLPLIRAFELGPAVLDAALPLLVAIVACVVGLLLVVAVGLSGVHLDNAGPADYLSVASWLTASSLGAPLGGSSSAASSDLGGSDFGFSDLNATVSVSLRFAVLLFTALILILGYRAARRRERATASVSLGQLVARAALPAIATSLILLVLGLATHRTSAFETQGLLDPGGDAGSSSGKVGIETPYVFLGPLLLVFAVALIGRLGAWMQASSNADVRAHRLRATVAAWTPAWRTVWLQLRIIGVLAGVGLWVYVIIEAPSDSSTNSHSLAFIFGALVLILNLSVYGMFAGFGATLFITLSGLGGTSFGLLSGHRPWGLWLLLLAVVIGTAAPAVLARRARGTGRFAVRPQDYPPAGAWRAVLLGLAFALVLTLLGTLELSQSLSGGGGDFGNFGATLQFAPSMFAALGLTALWCLIGYLAVSLSQGHSLSELSAPPVPGPPAPGYAGVAAPDAGDVTFPDSGETIGTATSNVQSPTQPTVPLAFGGEGTVTVPLAQTTSPGTSPAAPTAPLRAELGGRRIGIAVLALAVLVAGGFTAYHFIAGSSTSGPEAAVSSYFKDLASGDAKDAAALATGPYAHTPVVGAQTLTDPARRPSAFSVVTSRPLSSSEAGELRSMGADGSNFTYVAVTYTVHGAEQKDTFIAMQDAKTSAWKLVDPYRPLDVSGGWSDKVTVDGVSVDESSEFGLFPGAHVIADPASRDFAAESVTVYPTVDDGASGDVTQTSFGQAELPDPKLSDAGQTAAQNAYRDALTACATQAETSYGDCGLDNTYDYYTCNSVTWTITNVGQVTVDLSSGASDTGYDIEATGSTAEESGDYTDWDGTDQTFQNESADIEDSYGTLVFNADGSATVTLE